jgi:hypothetical protein
MYGDVRSDREHMSTSSEARQKAEVALAMALDESPHVTHPATRDAVHAFVDALAAEGLMPEAVVIAFKAVLLRDPTMHRFEPETRAELRTALVSECITHYFGGQTMGDAPPPSKRPKLKVIRGGEAGAITERQTSSRERSARREPEQPGG